MSLNHVYRQLARCVRLIMLDPKVADEFANDKASALASFRVLFFLIPYGLFITFVTEQKYIAHYNVDALRFVALNLATSLASTVLGIMAVYQMCRWQGLLDNFPRWLVSYNWLGVLMVLVTFIPSMITLAEALPRDGLIAMATLCYFFALYVSFVHS